MEEGTFASPVKIDAKWKANITASITIKDIRGKIKGMMSGNFAGKYMHVESTLIPMQTSYGGNPQMIRVGVEFEGVDPSASYEVVPVCIQFYRGRFFINTSEQSLHFRSHGHMIHCALKALVRPDQVQFNRVKIAHISSLYR